MARVRRLRSSPTQPLPGRSRFVTSSCSVARGQPAAPHAASAAVICPAVRQTLYSSGRCCAPSDSDSCCTLPRCRANHRQKEVSRARLWSPTKLTCTSAFSAGCRPAAAGGGTPAARHGACKKAAKVPSGRRWRWRQRTGPWRPMSSASPLPMLQEGQYMLQHGLR